jgi:hypothetical protein
MSAPLTSATRALLEAARAEVPGAAARAKMWGNVASATGVAGAGAAAAAVSAGLAGGGTSGALVAAGVSTATASASKLLAMGALLGSAVTVGIAITLLRMTPVTEPTTGERAAVTEASPVAPSPVPLDETAAPLRLASPVRLDAVRSSRGVGANDPGAEASQTGVPRRRIRDAAEDPLMREAALVAEARGAIVRGDAEAALSMLQAASRLRVRGLEPEELSLQAHALRVLGRSDEAEQAEVALRTRFPEHALSR